MYNVLDVARYTVCRCIKWHQPLSNFKLQQFLAQLHEVYSIHNNCMLFQTEMNRTSIGWELPVVYERYKGWAGVEIIYNVDDTPMTLRESDRLFIDKYLERYLKNIELNAKHPTHYKPIDYKTYYLEIAKTVLLRGTCLRRNYGAVIVRDDRILGTGFTGACRGDTHCTDTGNCVREQLNIPSGERYELCVSVHAEQNAVINAQCDVSGAVLFLAGRDMQTGEYLADPKPCSMCRRVLKNAGIVNVVTSSN